MGITMIGDWATSLFGITMIGDATLLGITMIGDFAAILFGITMMGDLTLFGMTMIGEATLFGMTMMGDATRFGITIIGELALRLDKDCVAGVATALAAETAIAIPRATHETFNHDEVILEFLSVNNENCKKTNANSAILYNKSTAISKINCQITLSCTVSWENDGNSDEKVTLPLPC